MLPNATGGANWQGAAADPETGMLYVPSVTNPYVAALVHDPKHSDMDYIAQDRDSRKDRQRHCRSSNRLTAALPLTI